MKKIFLSVIILFSFQQIMAQAKSVWGNGAGITLSYFLIPQKSVVNPETGTKFNTYQVITRLINLSSNDVAVTNIYCKFNFDKSALNHSDAKFCSERNNTGHFHGQLCRFNVLCTNTTVLDIPKYIVCPQGEVPVVEGYNIQVSELDDNKQTVSKTNTNNNLNNTVSSKTKDYVPKKNTQSKAKDYTSLIIGKWKMIGCTRLNGENLPWDVDENYFSDFKSNGNLINWNAQFYGKAHTNMRWKISGKTLNFNEDQYDFDGKLIPSYGVDYEITNLDETTLILKYESSGLDDGVRIYKYIKIE